MNKINEHLICPDCGAAVRVYHNPLPTVDVIVRHNGGIVLIERGQPPYGWAIPGGFMEYGETCEETAIREMKEEINLELENLVLLTVRSAPDRDPRHHTVTIVFHADGSGDLKAGDDAANVIIINDISARNYAFDHKEVLELYMKKFPLK